MDDVALWTHVAARCGFAVQSVGLLLVDTDFVYPGHGCYAGLFREVDLGPVLGSRPVAELARTPCASGERGSEPRAHAAARIATRAAAASSRRAARPVQLPAPVEHAETSLDILGRESRGRMARRRLPLT